MQVHFYHVKDQLMSNFHKASQLPEQYPRLQLYADLSQYTLQKRKSLLPITKALRNHITYRWGYPVKLIITHNDASSMKTTLNKGLALLRSRDSLPEQDPASWSSPTRINTQEDWQTVSYNHKQKIAPLDHLLFSS